MSTTEARPAGPMATTPATPPRSLTTRRRRPALIGLSIALIAAGGLAGAFTVLTSGEKTQLLAVARDVPYGRTVTANDLVVVSVGLDPALKPVKAAEKNSIIGQRAATELKAGALLAEGSVTDEPLVGDNEQLVGLRLKPGQLPASKLSPGTKVLVVSTPAKDTTAETSKQQDSKLPQTLPATVIEVGTADSSGSLTLDVAVAATDGPTLASRAASGNIAVVVEPRKADD
ncbi:SAF domain-containing protein [Streptomyces sp. WMMC940]|uniref:SAF domain-containing protein n=1 Tax=Streptomyces sp. WMMC940 TaxID=3015153 RepID=UPI0022B636C4|nr:SAF domain-containing protein [Streptomyces sp. WMMC940]MCZ7458221.1 SAF domain-containing protein [Streptomyces sp. WMMC940]